MTKLCPRGKAAAKRKFAVYPSAYANAYASKICAGKIKDPSGVKRKDFKGPKKAVLGALIGFGAAAAGKKFLKKKSSKMLGMDNIKPGETVAELYKKKMQGTQGPIRTMNKGGGADMSKVKTKKAGPAGGIKRNRKPKTMLDKKGFQLKYPNRGSQPGNPVVMYSVKKGGLTAELNNPAKGYTKGGMSDYYKDLM